MNILRLTCENYGRFQHADLEFPLGAVALIGPNGAGKSRLLAAIELALFADGSRDLSPWLAPWAEQAQVPLQLELIFEHAGIGYRVRRSYTGGKRGKATLDLEFVPGDSSRGLPEDPDWHPVSKENAAATQAYIEHVLGLSRRAFRASSFLAQGDAGAFTEASAVDRKFILGEVLDPRGLWPALAEMAKADLRAAEQALQADAVKIAEREAIAETREDLDYQLDVAQTQRAEQSTEHRNAAEALEQAQRAEQASATAQERHRAAQQALQAAAQERERAASALLEAQSLADQLPEVRERLAACEREAAKVPALEAKAEERRAVLAEIEHAKGAKRGAEALAAQALREADRAAAEHIRLIDQQNEVAGRYEHLQEAAPGAERCPTCAQLLGVEAREAALATLSAELHALTPQLIQAAVVRDEATAAALAASDAAALLEAPEPPSIQDWDGPLRAARQAAERRSGLKVLLAGYEEQSAKVPRLEQALAAAEAALQARAAEMAQAAESLQDGTELGRAVSDARAALQARQVALDAAKAQCVRLEAELARVSQAEAELQELKQAAAARQAEAELLALAAKAFGRDGIPVLLVENVLGQIEADANRLLELMPTEDGVTLRVRLETQRALKTADHLRETLDVLVADQDGVRAYETYSGGERSRLNICLRIALAVLLADRRGAESRLLAVDEVEYLDALGQDQLVAVVAAVADRFDRVLVVSHSPQVRDAFERVVEVAKRDGVSRVVAAREAVVV